MSCSPKLLAGWSLSGYCVVTILLLSPLLPRNIESHDRPHIRQLALPVGPTRIYGWYPVPARSLAVEFNIISIQRKDRIPLKWVEMLRDCSYVMRRIVWKFFSGLA